MEHGLPLISTLVIAFSLALIFGFVCERFLKSPALVGYLLAGVAAGQHTPGVFADPALAHQLSEIGVMLPLKSGENTRIRTDAEVAGRVSF